MAHLYHERENPNTSVRIETQEEFDAIKFLLTPDGSSKGKAPFSVRAVFVLGCIG